MFAWWLNFPTFASRFGGRETVKKEGEKEVSKKICKIEKDFYLCSPKQNGVTKRSLVTE
jgi:hypothetical protein